MNVNNAIKNIRLNNHLTQEKFSEMLYCSTQTISNVERGVSLPSVDFINLISRKFNVPINLILSNKLENDVDEKILEVSLSLLKNNILPSIDLIAKQLIVCKKEVKKSFFSNEKLISFIVKNIDKDIKVEIISHFANNKSITENFLNAVLPVIKSNSLYLLPLYRDPKSNVILIKHLRKVYSTVLMHYFEIDNELQINIIISCFIEIINAMFTYDYGLSNEELKKNIVYVINLLKVY